MVAALRSSTQRSMNILTHWTTDRGTYPVVFCTTFAAIAASGLAVRNLTKSPDVFINKHKLEAIMHHEEDIGNAYQGHRFRSANAKRNSINHSQQFDILLLNQRIKI